MEAHMADINSIALRPHLPHCHRPSMGRCILLVWWILATLHLAGARSTSLFPPAIIPSSLSSLPRPTSDPTQVVTAQGLRRLHQQSIQQSQVIQPTEEDHDSHYTLSRRAPAAADVAAVKKTTPLKKKKKTTTSSTKRKTTSKSTSRRSTTTKRRSTATSTSKKTTSKTSTGTSGPTPSPVLQSSPLELLIQNNLDWSTLDQHTGYLLVGDPYTYSKASGACGGLSEKLATVRVGDQDLKKQLSYLIFKGVYKSGQAFWTAGQKVITLKGNDGSYTLTYSKSSTPKHPALCTQSARRTTAYQTDLSDSWNVRVTAGGNVVTGYRDALSFRFHAIPYANTPSRFAYSSVYSRRGAINATGTGTEKQCPQSWAPYSEDCLVLNLWTNYLRSASASPPKAASRKKKKKNPPRSIQEDDDPVAQQHGEEEDEEEVEEENKPRIAARATDKRLKPIMLWLHGGGNRAGTGLDPTFDGGQMASRGDVVVVSMNYRLGSLGFLPIDDTHKGNYGLQDVVTALKWLRANAATFGGDASRITLFGQSAGAILIEYLLGNPSAKGLFHNVIIQSGKPADVHNGSPTPAATELSSAAVIKKLGCANAASVLTCLRELPVEKFLTTTVYSKVSVDGTNVPQQQFALNGRGRTTNRVPVIMGYMRDEQAALGYVPPASLDLPQAMINAGIPSTTREIILNNTDVFSLDIPNGVRNLTVTIQTNNETESRCGTAATAYAAVKSRAFPAVWVYTQDQRAYQIPNYDPNSVCSPAQHAQAGNASAYYFCHSGDLLATFATPMYEFGMPDRDGQDLVWMRNQVDQWTAFARSSDPNPSARFLSARGYGPIQGDPWPQVKVSQGSKGAKMISLGARQKAVPLADHARQCNLIGHGIEYVFKGGRSGDDFGV